MYGMHVLTLQAESNDKKASERPAFKTNKALEVAASSAARPTAIIAGRCSIVEGPLNLKIQL
jgi:hypothetical protein